MFYAKLWFLIRLMLAFFGSDDGAANVLVLQHCWGSEMSITCDMGDNYYLTIDHGEFELYSDYEMVAWAAAYEDGTFLVEYGEGKEWSWCQYPEMGCGDSDE